MATTPNRSWPTPDDTDLVRDGAAAIRALGDAIDGSVGQGFVYAGTRYYESSGTFEKADPFDDGNPNGLVVRAIRVTAVGGGGGGGGGEATGAGESSFGDGGGGGGCAIKFYLAADLDASESVVRGAGAVGGVGDGSGSTGGSSTFRGLSADGGQGASRRLATTSNLLSTNTALGQGGTSSGGDVNFAGGPGENGYIIDASTAAGVKSGNGGSSIFGSGAKSGGQGDGPAGDARGGFGGGGSGARNGPNRAAASGGAGGNGIVILDIFV